MSDLKKKAVSGVKWNTLYSIVTAIGGPLTLIVLARFLTPEEFGILAVIGVISAVSHGIATMGFSQAIVQRKDIQYGDLSSIFWFEQVIGITAFLIIFLAAGPISSFFDIDAIWVIRVSALVFIIEPIDLVFRALLRKELKYDILMKARLTKHICKDVITIGLAILGFGVMSVVIGTLSGIILLTIILFFVFYRNDMWMPKLHFSFEQLKPYLKFGIFVAGNSIMENIIYRIDEIIIGGILGPGILGMYYFAKRLLRDLLKLIRGPISDVSFPLFSKISDNKKLMRKTYVKVTKMLGSIGAPAYVGIAVTSPLFIPLIFGDTWIEAVPIIFALTGCYIAISLFGGVFTALYSQGRSDIKFYVAAIELPIRASVVYLFSHMGLLPLALAISGFEICKFLTYQFILKRLIGLKLLSVLSSIKYILVSSLMMGVTIYFFDRLINLGTLIDLILMMGIGIAIYGGLMYVFEKKFIKSIVGMVIGR